MTVSSAQRFKKSRPCPICGGGENDRRGQGKRCTGFLSDDGEYAHCSRGEFAGSLAEEKGGTFPHKLKGSCRCGTTHGGQVHQQNFEIEATYDYRDEGGSLLFQVVRFVGKEFKQRRPDGGGGWDWKLNGVRRVPYRLRELMADDGPHAIYVVEGEKDVDTLVRRGQSATCNPGGAGQWRFIANVARVALKGRDVIVIADADEPGRKHAADVEASLRDVVSTLRVVECQRGKDISDHLAAGGTLDELVPMRPPPAEQPATPDGQGPTAEEPLRGLPKLGAVAIIGKQRILELAAKPVVYIWQDIALTGIVVVIAGGPGSGKTTLLFLVLAARLSLGAPAKVLGRQVTPAPKGAYVVLIEAEHGDSSTARKLVRSCRLLGVGDDALDRVIMVARRGVRIGSPEWQEVGQMVAAGLVSDIALDTLARVAPADANDEREQVAIFDQVAQTIERAPTAESRPVVWTVAHTRKTETDELADVSGSTQRTGQADTVLMVKAEKSDGKVTSSKVTFAKLREEPDEYPMPVEYTVTTEAVVDVDRPADDDRPLEVRIVERLSLGPRTKSALAKELKVGKPSLEEAISNLFSARQIESADVVIKGTAYKGFALRRDPV